MAEFFTHRNIKATRNEHTCEGCAAKIAPGDPAWYFSMKDEGYFWAGHYHAECRAAECELNDLHDNRGDDWIGLASIADEPEDVAWLVDEHPAVAARMNLTKPVAV